MYDDADFPELPAVALAPSILPMLTELGLEVQPRTPHLRIPLKYEDCTYAIAFVVAAENLFFPHLFARDARRLRSEQWEVILGEDVPEKGKKDWYVFIVASEEFITDEANTHLIYELENDTSSSQKFVVTKNQLKQRLGSFGQLFGLKEEGAPATSTARVLINGPVPDAPMRTLTLAILPQMLDPAPFVSAENYELANDARKIFSKIMGSEFHLQFFSDGIRVARDRDSLGFPMPFVSNGERVGVAVAIFLARALHCPHPAGEMLAFSGIFSSFDELKSFRLLDTVREYVMATGGSLYLVIPNSAVARYAVRKFAMAGINAQIQERQL